MRASGWAQRDGDTECKRGKMARGMRGTGVTIWPQVKASLPTVLETYTRDSGKTIRRMALGRMCMRRQELGTKATGKTTCSMVLEFKLMPIKIGTKE